MTVNAFKKTLSLLLALIVLLSICAGLPTAAASTYKVVTVKCVSNLKPTYKSVKLLAVNDRELFIPVPYACLFSGYGCDNAELFDKPGNNDISGFKFKRDLDYYECNDVIAYEDYYWVPLNETMCKLQTEVRLFGEALAFDGTVCTAREMDSIVKSNVFGGSGALRNGFSIYDTSGVDTVSAMTWVGASAFHDSIVNCKLFDRLIGCLEKAVTGVDRYQSKYYDELLSNVLVMSGPDERYDAERYGDNIENFKEFQKQMKDSKTIAEGLALLHATKVFDDEIDVSEVKDIKEITDFFAHTDDRASFGAGISGFDKTILDLIDPVGSLLKSAYGVEIKGWDFVSQFEIFYGFYRALNASPVSANVIINTFYYDGRFDANTDDFPECNMFVRELYELRSGDRYRQYKQAFVTEWTSMAMSTLEEIAKKKLEQTTGLLSFEMKLGATLARAMLPLIDPNYNENKAFADLGNKFVPLLNLQNLALDQYYSYWNDYKSGNKEAAINAKYAAMLYTNLFIQYCTMSTESGINLNYNKNAAETVYSLLADIDDVQLQRTVSESNITFADLNGENKKQTDEDGDNKKQTDDTESGIKDPAILGDWYDENGVLCYTFRNDGTVFVVGRDECEFYFQSEDTILIFQDDSFYGSVCRYKIHNNVLTLNALNSTGGDINYYRSPKGSSSGGGGKSGGGGSGGGSSGAINGDWVIVESGGEVTVSFKNGKETIYVPGDSQTYSYTISGDIITVTHENNSKSVYRYEISGNKMYFYDADTGELYIEFKRK